MGHLIEDNSVYGTGWRKIKNWRRALKNKMLVLSHATDDKSKNRQERLEKSAKSYLYTARLLSDKLVTVQPLNPSDMAEQMMFVQLHFYRKISDKHYLCGILKTI